MQLLLPIFASAIVGGVGSPLGAIVGGFVIAFSEIVCDICLQKSVTYLGLLGEPHGDGCNCSSTDYKFAVSFVILVIVLLVKPTGIFSGKTI